MAYYSGIANSLDDILLALQNAAQSNGWSVSGEILHKNDLYVRAWLVAGTNEGIVFQGGTGIDTAGELIDPSPVRPRFGRPKPTDAPWSWPSRYFIHVHTDPDEIYLLMNYSVEYYQWCAFGKSEQPGLNGTGLWVSAANGYNPAAAYGSPDSRVSYNIGVDSGGEDQTSSWNEDRYAGAPFWNTKGKITASAGGNEHRRSDTIHANLNDYPSNWMGYSFAGYAGTGNWQNKINAVQPAMPHIARLPSLWNQEGILIPIQVYCWRASSKCSLVLEVRHSRYTRIDNYEPGQVITIGSERWKIYPFIRKYVAQRNGPANINQLHTTGSHTGTLGWAIRYDGP